MTTAETNPSGGRRRSPSLVLILVVALATLAATSGVAEAQTDEATERVAVRDAERPERLRLGCAPDDIDGRRGVVCRWSEASDPNTRAYRLYRSVDGAAREVVATVGADGRLGHFDTDVSAPSRIVYGVVSLGPGGRLLGRSAPARVQYGPLDEQLRLSCTPENIGDTRGVLCRWSATSAPHARGYLLYRSADGDARNVIARVGLDRRLAHFDTDVAAGSAYVYGVVAVDRTGEILAVGGPEHVRLPTGD